MERNINVWLPLAHPTLGTWPVDSVWLSGLSANLRTKGSLVCSKSGHVPGLWARSLVEDT